jgi:hypothetical protein
MILLAPLLLTNDLFLLRGLEDFTAGRLITQLTIESLADRFENPRSYGHCEKKDK